MPLSLELALDVLMPSFIVFAGTDATDLERQAWQRLVDEVEANRAAFHAKAEAQAVGRARASEEAYLAELAAAKVVG